jgi:hypothetical protein
MVLVPFKSYNLIGSADQQLDLETSDLAYHGTNASAIFSCRHTALNRTRLIQYPHYDVHDFPRRKRPNSTFTTKQTFTVKGITIRLRHKAECIQVSKLNMQD